MDPLRCFCNSTACLFEPAASKLNPVDLMGVRWQTLPAVLPRAERLIGLARRCRPPNAKSSDSFYESWRCLKTETSASSRDLSMPLLCHSRRRRLRLVRCRRSGGADVRLAWAVRYAAPQNSSASTYMLSVLRFNMRPL